jgi:hypothetical protein
VQQVPSGRRQRFGWLLQPENEPEAQAQTLRMRGHVMKSCIGPLIRWRNSLTCRCQGSLMPMSVRDRICQHQPERRRSRRVGRCLSRRRDSS